MAGPAGVLLPLLLQLLLPLSWHSCYLLLLLLLAGGNGSCYTVLV